MRASVHPLSNPGHAVLRVTEIDAAPQGLALSIQRQQGPDSHLADDGWRRTETWLVPSRVKRSGTVLEFELGPEICDRLAGVATVRLRIREPDIGVVGTTVVAWPPMLTSGAAHHGADDDDNVVRLRRALGPVREEAAPAEPPPPQPDPPLRALRDPPTQPRNVGTWAFYGALLLVIVAGGAYAYWHFMRGEEARPVAAAPALPQPAPTAAAASGKKSIREVTAEYFATNPGPEAMVATAKAYVQANDLEGAFLVWRRAAEAGHPDAQLALGEFYDPLVQPPKAGFTPDGRRAVEWYERAALAGSAEAQRKVGLLLAKGGAGLSADTAKARTWLQQAAAQNDVDARKALDSLPK